LQPATKFSSSVLVFISYLLVVDLGVSKMQKRSRRQEIHTPFKPLTHSKTAQTNVRRDCFRSVWCRLSFAKIEQNYRLKEKNSKKITPFYKIWFISMGRRKVSDETKLPLEI
jgi:hypothetical protein